MLDKSQGHVVVLVDTQTTALSLRPSSMPLYRQYLIQMNPMTLNFAEMELKSNLTPISFKPSSQKPITGIYDVL